MRISDWSSDVCSSDLEFGGIETYKRLNLANGLIEVHYLVGTHSVQNLFSIGRKYLETDIYVNGLVSPELVKSFCKYYGKKPAYKHKWGRQKGIIGIDTKE